MVKSPKSNVIYNELYLTYEELKRFFDKELSYLSKENQQSVVKNIVPYL